MVVPAHNLITYSGVFGTSASPIEEWSFSVKTSPINFGTPAARFDYATRRKSELLASLLWGSFQTSVRLTRVRVAEVDLGLVGKDAGGAYKQGDSVADAAGGTSGGVVMPLQTALVVSLTTNRAGPTGKGRFYLPWPGLGLEADYRIDQAKAQAKTDQVKALLDLINADPAVVGDFGRVIVASSKGYTSAVTGIRVGRAPDTMRSRRSDLIEGYTTAQLV
jgi:hypothetical protein